MFYHVYWSESELSFVIGGSSFGTRPTLTICSYTEQTGATLDCEALNTHPWKSGELSALLMRVARQRETERAFNARRYSA